MMKIPHFISLLNAVAFLAVSCLVGQASADSIFIHEDWPSKVAAPSHEKLHLRNIKKNKSKKKNFEYESLRYTYTSDVKLSTKAHQQIGELLDCVYDSAFAISEVLPIKRKLSKRPSGKKLKAAFSTKPYGKHKGGVYISSSDTIHMTFRVVGLSEDGSIRGRKVRSGIPVHEATHQLFSANKLPVWVNEGIADYMGYTPYEDDQLDFTQSVEAVVTRSESAKPLVYPFDLVDLFAMDREEFYQRQGKGENPYFISCLTVTYFLHLSGEDGLEQFQDFLKALSSGASPTKAAEKLYKSTSQLQEDLMEAWAKQGVHIKFSKE